MSDQLIKFVTRSQWLARPPSGGRLLQRIPSYVFIHHTYKPEACYNLADGIKAMQAMQNFQMDHNKWDDIGYNFVIASDGHVFEGRGWDRIGAHTEGYNSLGLGFAVLGNFNSDIPHKLALDALRNLIEYAVKIGKLDENYIIRCHRDMIESESPGQAFYNLIKTWTHY